MCFRVMRNADSAGREIAGWEPIASADKASSGASAQAPLGRRSGALWGQDPQRAHKRAPAAHSPYAQDPGRGRGPGLGGGAGHSPCSPRLQAPPPHGRSWRVKMRALIVTKRRRPSSRPLPAALRAALAAVCPPRWPHLQLGRRCRGEEVERLGPPPPAPPPKPGRSCPRLCAPFVPRRDRYATLIRSVTDGGGDRRFHLLTSNVGAGEGETGARPWPARWLRR